MVACSPAIIKHSTVSVSVICFPHFGLSFGSGQSSTGEPLALDGGRCFTPPLGRKGSITCNRKPTRRILDFPGRAGIGLHPEAIASRPTHPSTTCLDPHTRSPTSRTWRASRSSVLMATRLSMCQAKRHAFSWMPEPAFRRSPVAGYARLRSPRPHPLTPSASAKHRRHPSAAQSSIAGLG